MDDFVKERIEYYAKRMERQRQLKKDLHLLKLRENHEIQMTTNPKYRRRFLERQRIKYHIKKEEHEERKYELNELKELVKEYETIIKEQQELIEDLYHDLGV